MASKIKSLKALDFIQSIKARTSHIEDAPANPVPKTDDYLANKLAKELHPVVQFLKVDKIVERAGGVKSFTLVKEDGGKVAYFSAGQYLTISLDIEGKKICRPYSISSSPKQASEGSYELTIKRVDGGLATNYILDNWTVGTKVVASEPSGVFTYEPLRDAKTIIGLAGGSGITPFMSLAKAIADGDEDANLVLLFGSRTEADILFKDELDAIEQKCNRVKIVHVLSGEENAKYENGFISADLIKKYAPEGEYSVFVCGPQAMYNFVDKEIAKLGLRGKFIRHEVFGEYRNPENDAEYPTGAQETCKITVKHKGETKTITASANDTILNSLEKNGIAALSRCRSGICGWCHAKLESGKVYIPKTVDYRRLADYDYGYIHPCCTFPVSDIVIIVK